MGTATSSTGGATWTAGTTQAGPMSLSWLADTTQGRMVGDYISTSFVGAVAFPVFAVASAPSGTTFDESMATLGGGLTVSASGATAGGTATVMGGSQQGSSTVKAQ